MKEQEIIPHLFRTTYRKITAVLCKRFGIARINVAEDIVSDAFLAAAETWAMKGVPGDPESWLYAVARNRARDYLKREALYREKISRKIKDNASIMEEMEVDLSPENIADSQLQMLFAVCHPSLSPEAQVGLALRILCGFGIGEIADAFLSNKETINKRLYRAKAILRKQNVKIEVPPPSAVEERLDLVLTTLYLLFNEGYYSLSHQNALRYDLCLEAMRLTSQLLENERTAQPRVNALLSLMCFHASRFRARNRPGREQVLLEEQDPAAWDQKMIVRGQYYLARAAKGATVSNYHLEAAIAYWHTTRVNRDRKWKEILRLYDRLLEITWTPVAAMNRLYALAMVAGKETAIAEIEKMDLPDGYVYHSLAGWLYTGIDRKKALRHLRTALHFARTESHQHAIAAKIKALDS